MRKKPHCTHLFVKTRLWFPPLVMVTNGPSPVNNTADDIFASLGQKDTCIFLDTYPIQPVEQYLGNDYADRINTSFMRFLFVCLVLFFFSSNNDPLAGDFWGLKLFRLECESLSSNPVSYCKISNAIIILKET